MKVSFAAGLLPVLAAASPVMIDTIHNGAAPILSSSNAKEIPDSYMVVFKDQVSHAAANRHHEWVQRLHLETEDARVELRKRSQYPLVDEVFEGLKHTFFIPGGLVGYSGRFDEEVVEQVRRHPDVSAIAPIAGCLVMSRMVRAHPSPGRVD